MQKLDPHTTDHDDLRAGRSPWNADGRPPRRVLDCDRRCDALVVGAGITGAMVAEHLSSLGYDVTILDREKPGLGSTVASTAMLQWEIDRSLTELTDLYGFEAAALTYSKSFQAVQALQSHVATLGLHCLLRPRETLYLSNGSGSGAVILQREADLRARAGLPSRFLDHRALLADFGIEREAALLSAGSAEADPVCLAHQLLRAALARGAMLFDGEAAGFETAPEGVAVQLADGPVIEAANVILATGYVMPNIVRSVLNQPSASWALATRPQRPELLWPRGALIWEDADPYSYLRTTADRRIIIGGEDDPNAVEPEPREAAMDAKIGLLLGKLHILFPGIEANADYAWSGVFGETPDGLPLIGPLPGHHRLFAAYGYGGNGITFSFLAARIVARQMRGLSEAWDERLALDRPGPHALGV
jgi:glycine/D-amino acid oxidase-like deaminating enzyme